MQSKFSLYRSFPVLTAFDNDVPPPTDDVPTQPADPPVDDQGKTFTQEQMNKVLAEDRRKHSEKLKQVESQLSTLVETAQLTEAEKADLQKTRAELQKQLMTKEQIAAQERRTLKEKYDEEIKAEREARQAAESKYEDATIKRALSDAATLGDAFSNGQVVDLLRSNTKLVDDQPMVDFPDIHVETGEAIVTQLSPEDAIKRMKELPDKYGNLFKANVINGVGGNASSGDVSRSGGKVDVKSLTPEQYAKLRQENPAALGLR